MLSREEIVSSALVCSGTTSVVPATVIGNEKLVGRKAPPPPSKRRPSVPGWIGETRFVVAFAFWLGRGKSPVALPVVERRSLSTVVGLATCDVELMVVTWAA